MYKVKRFIKISQLIRIRLLIKQSVVQVIGHDHEKHIFSFVCHFESFYPQKYHFVLDFSNDLFVELLQESSLCLGHKNRQLPLIYCHVANILKIYHTKPQIRTVKHFEAIERYLQVSFTSENS